MASDLIRDTETEEKPHEVGTETEGVQPQARDTWATASWKRQEGHSPKASGRSAALPTP